MPCTTILVGKNASYDGSTLMARNDDSGGGCFNPKKFIVVNPEEQPSVYRSESGRLEMRLPEDPLRYTSMPNAVPGKGVWGEAGVNEANVAMTATETLTSNPRVLGADPLVDSGIGEEDLLTIVLPYIRTAREGVLRLGGLIEEYGTYEMNGIGFQDADEIWWFESIGGHHWMAKRVPDDAYAVAPNQQAIDFFDFSDAKTNGRDHLCAADLIEFVRVNHLDLTVGPRRLEETVDFDARAAFGGSRDSDHAYNTPRAWYMERMLNPNTFRWDGENADYRPDSDNIPWSMTPEHKITVEDIKRVLSSYYQGTPFDPYGRRGDAAHRGQYRPIGINRNSFLAVTQLRSGLPRETMAVAWIAVGSNAFNAVVPFYTNVLTTPAYLACTSGTVSTDSFYWNNRLIAVMTDAHYSDCITDVERYQQSMSSMGHEMLKRFDDAFLKSSAEDVCAWLAQCNKEISDRAQAQTADLLDKVLLKASNGMKNAFARSDA